MAYRMAICKHDATRVEVSLFVDCHCSGEQTKRQLWAHSSVTCRSQACKWFSNGTAKTRAIEVEEFLLALVSPRQDTVTRRYNEGEKERTELFRALTVHVCA